MPFNGPIIPLGAMVEHHPSLRKTSRDCISSAQMSCQEKSSVMHCTRRRIWKGDIMVADSEELEEMDASGLHDRRLNAKEVLTPQRSGNFIFPNRRGNSQNLWVRTASENIHLDPPGTDRNEAKNKEIFKENSEWFAPSHLQEDSARDDEEVKSDLWTSTWEFICRHHVVPRVKLYVPKEESFPIPMKFIDVTRTTHTSSEGQGMVSPRHVQNRRRRTREGTELKCMQTPIWAGGTCNGRTANQRPAVVPSNRRGKNLQ